MEHNKAYYDFTIEFLKKKCNEDLDEIAFRKYIFSHLNTIIFMEQKW